MFFHCFIGLFEAAQLDWVGTYSVSLEWLVSTDGCPTSTKKLSECDWHYRILESCCAG